MLPYVEAFHGIDFWPEEEIANRISSDSIPVDDEVAQTVFTILHQIFSAQPAISISIKLIESAENNVEVLVRKILRHLLTAGIP